MKNPLSTLTYTDFKKIYLTDRRFGVMDNCDNKVGSYSVIDSKFPYVGNSITYEIISDETHTNYTILFDNLDFNDATLIAHRFNKDEELYLREIFDYCKYNHRVS